MNGQHHEQCNTHRGYPDTAHKDCTEAPGRFPGEQTDHGNGEKAHPEEQGGPMRKKVLGLPRPNVLA